MSQQLDNKVSWAIRATERMSLETPGWKSVQAALDQLKLLQTLLSSQVLDRNALGSINLGLLAVREFDERDPQYAETLLEIQKLIKEEISKLSA